MIDTVVFFKRYLSKYSSYIPKQLVGIKKKKCLFFVLLLIISVPPQNTLENTQKRKNGRLNMNIFKSYLGDYSLEFSEDIHRIKKN